MRYSLYIDAAITPGRKPRKSTMNSATKYTDPVVVERMPEYLRGSHRAAAAGGNWGSYPANGAERVIVERAETEVWCYDVDSDDFIGIGADEYDHIVRSATEADFENYSAE